MFRKSSYLFQYLASWHVTDYWLVHTSHELDLSSTKISLAREYQNDWICVCWSTGLDLFIRTATHLICSNTHSTRFAMLTIPIVVDDSAESSWDIPLSLLRSSEIKVLTFLMCWNMNLRIMSCSPCSDWFKGRNDLVFLHVAPPNNMTVRTMTQWPSQRQGVT